MPCMKGFGIAPLGIPINSIFSDESEIFTSLPHVGCSTLRRWISCKMSCTFHQFYATAANRMIFLIAAIARARCVDINFVSVHHQAPSSHWDTMYWRSPIFMKNQGKSMISVHFGRIWDWKMSKKSLIFIDFSWKYAIFIEL